MAVTRSVQGPPGRVLSGVVGQDDCILDCFTRRSVFVL